MPEIREYEIEDVKRLHEDAGRFFFEPNAMRGFASEVDDCVYNGVGGHFFLTSEQFVGSNGKAGERLWTIRQFHPANADITTVGPFLKLREVEAREAASDLAEGGRTAESARAWLAQVKARR